jgi:NTP pyrophosphatase (non-canonical NTP hydrolase)
MKTDQFEDGSTRVSDLKAKVKAFNYARKWEQFHTPKEVAISIAIEASELLEVFQWRAISRSDVKNDDNILEDISEELADIMIYIISLANNLDIDLSKAVTSKLEKNALKYPIKNR